MVNESRIQPVIDQRPRAMSNGYGTNGASMTMARRPQKNQGYDWLGAVLRRKSILIFTVTVAAVIGYLFYTRQPKVYASQLKLMIWTQAPPSIVNGETIVQPVSTGKHVNLLTSEVVLAKAADEGDLGSLRTFTGQTQPVYALKGMLDVEPVEDAADTLLLTARGPDPLDLPGILTSVVASYQEILSEDAAAIGKSSVELIEKLQERVAGEKSTTEERYFELVQKLGLSPDPTTGQYINPHFARIEELRTQKATRELEFRELTERVASVRDVENLPEDKRKDLLRVVAIEASKYLAINSREERELDKGSPEIVKIDARIDVMEETLSGLRLKASKIKRTVGDKHPTAAVVASDIESYSGQLASLFDTRRQLQSDLSRRSNQSTANEKAISASDTALVQMYLASMQRESDRLKNSLEGLDTEIAQLEEKAAAVRGEIEELNLLSGQIQEKDKVIREILDQLSGLTVVASNYTSTKVRVIDNPGLGKQVEPKLLVILSAFILGGGMLGFGIIALLDWSDLSYRNPTEIKERLGLPVVARIAKMRGAGKLKEGHSECLVTIDRPQSPVAEAYRACRTAMLFLAKQNNIKCFLITSAAAGDGKSTTALNLATCFAQGGLKTVIVDADLRRPRCHVYLGLKSSPGLKDFSLGDATTEEIIRPSDLQPNLSVVTAGKHFSNPSEFIDSAQFDELLKQLRQDFDIVIVDSPPVLPVADAMALSSLCDGVLLVMKIRKGVVLSSEKAVETLRTVNANLLGVIVNQVEKLSHYSDYGKYGYNGYGGYSYYAGRYYGKQNDKYYESESKSSKVESES